VKQRRHNPAETLVRRTILEEDRVISHHVTVTLVKVAALEPIGWGAEDRPHGLRVTQHHNGPKCTEL
jgi:hypothetical protein